MRHHIGLLSLFTLASGMASAAERSAPKATLLGSIAIANPSFLELVDGREAGSKELIISTFAVFGTSTVSRLPLSPQSLLDLEQAKPLTLTSKITWPNNATAVPNEILGENYLAVASGFLTPGANTGAVNLINVYTNEVVPIAATKKNYFYHRVQFTDVNGDGRLDAVTARAKKPLIGSSDGEILWLEQPADKVKGNWKEHVIAKGPDSHFQLIDFDGDGKMEILSAEFFSQKLSMQWQENGTWKSKVIDATLGSAFDVQLADLNGDGKTDLLVTNHEEGAKGSIFAYEIPEDFKTGSWTRHTLLSDIVTQVEGKHQGSPGTAFAVQPSTASNLKKPWIIASGDGSTRVHRLIPTSSDANDWSYQEDTLLDTESTIGKLAIGDVDGDGRVEIFAPAYHDAKIYVIKL